MRPKFSVWSDYGAPAQRQWMSASRRGPGASIGPKILLAAVVVVAGVIGISGIYPQVIDAEWVPDTGTRLPVMSLSTPDARTKALGSAAAIPLPPRRVATTGQSPVAPARAASASDQAPSRSLAASDQPPLRATAEAVAPLPETAAPLTVADVPDAEAKADALPGETAPAAKATEKTAEKPKVVAKKKVVVHRQRNFNGAYAQYNGWGWPGGGGGGWGGWGGGGYRRF
jgi:hypothetical protein